MTILKISLLSILMLCTIPDLVFGQCSISDLLVEPTACYDDSLFDAIISFNYSHTSDSFEVRGNGIFYGTFAYADEPITIENLNGDCQTLYEFVIIDSENNSCAEDIGVGVVCCDSTSVCDISDLTVAEIDCNNSGSYNFSLNFNYSNPGNDFYDVWINNEFVGFYSLADLPQRFENITPRPNSDYDIIRVCINDQPNCCAVLEYMQPDCTPNDDCSIRDLLVEPTACHDDALFDAIISFNYSHTSDSFEVRGNGNFYGTFAYADEPITIENLNGDCQTPYEFVIIDSENSSCAEDIGVGVVCCDSTSVCDISDLTVAEIDCNNSGSYNFTLNFNYSNPGNDFYDVWINNEFAGFYSLADLPQRFENITQRPNSDYDIIRVCINDQPNCCAVLEYMQPDCTPNDDCSIRDLLVEPTACHDDALFDAIISFNYSHTSDSFEVRGNGNFYGTFAYADEPITIENLNGDCQTPYEFVIIDSENNSCAQDIGVGIVCCDSTSVCDISDLTVAEIDCNNSGSYNFTLNFNYSNPGNDFYDVWINNEFAGFYSLADLPQRFENITQRPNSDYDIIRVCINDQPNCCAVLEYMQPDCTPNDDCSIRDLLVEPTACHDDALFDAIISFNYSHTSDSFEVRGNGNFYGTFAYADEPITIENLNGDCQTPYEFVIIDSENNSCAQDIGVGIVCCDSTSVCDISDLAIAEIDCNNSGSYNFTLNFNYSNPGNDFYDVWINNEFAGFYSLADLPQRFENITPRPNSDYDIIRVCINDQPNCCAVLEYMQPDCTPNDDCSIRDLLVEPTACHDDALFDAIISFNYSHTSDSFEVRGNGIFYGTFAYADEPITIENLNGDCQTPYEFVIIDSENRSCAEDIGVGVVCCDSTSVCDISDLTVAEIDCNNSGSYNFTLNFNYSNPGNDFYDVWINNEFAGFYSLADLPQRFENITPRPNSDYDIIRVCINDQPNCCAVLEYDVPDCAITDNPEFIISQSGSAISIQRPYDLSEPFDFMVYDMIGHQIRFGHSISHIETIDLGSMRSGFYVIQATSEDQRAVKKVWIEN